MTDSPSCSSLIHVTHSRDLARCSLLRTPLPPVCMACSTFGKHSFLSPSSPDNLHFRSVTMPGLTLCALLCFRCAHSAHAHFLLTLRSLTKRRPFTTFQRVMSRSHFQLLFCSILFNFFACCFTSCSYFTLITLVFQSTQRTHIHTNTHCTICPFC